MAIKSIGSGVNRRRQNYAPWWARNIQSVNIFLGLILIMVMAGYTYVSGMAYVVIKATKHWLINLMRDGQIWTEPKQLGLTWHHVFDWHHVLITNEWHNPIFPYIVFLGVATVLYMWWRVWSSYRTYNGNEKGAEYFTNPKQLKKEYQLIPDRNKEFPGYGGIPLVHYNNPLGQLIQSSSYGTHFSKIKKELVNLGNYLPGGVYGIDQTTVNNIIYGITRSGKGETIMLPLIDILSRAAKKCSMFVNDPKGEMFQLSTKILEKRGYKVYVLNLQNTTKSMSYNPLQIIIDYAKKGYYDEAQQEANRLSTAIYSNDNEKDPFWSNSSINLLNAMIYSQLDLAERHQSWDKVTMYNIYKQLTEMGGQEIPDPNVKGKTISKLSYYFDLMAKAPKSEFRDMALQAFQQSRFAGSETQGSIYASMMAGIKIYQERKVAQLTSMNSLDFRDAAFPRRIEIQFPKQMALQTCVVVWKNDKGNVIEKRAQKIDRQGYLNYPLKNKLTDKYSLEIDFNHKLTAKSLKKYKYIYRGKVLKRYAVKSRTRFNRVAGKISLDKSKSTIFGEEFNQTINFKYSEQPIAVFFVTPPHNPSYNQLVSFAMDQSFNQMYNMALGTAIGRKCYTRVHYIIDEGGNLPKIQDLATKFSIGLGSELLFDFVLQNKGQLRINYTKEEAETIISNCGNTLYILSKDLETAKEISDDVGNTTVNVVTHSMTPGISVARDNMSNSFEGVKVITPEELLRLKVGEMVVIRSTARTNQKGQIIRANPIFDTGKTRMPARWQILNRTFDGNATINDIKIDTPHEKLDLDQVSYNYVDDKFNDQNELDQMIDLVVSGHDDGHGDVEETATDEEKEAMAAMEAEAQLQKQKQNNPEKKEKYLSNVDEVIGIEETL